MTARLMFLTGSRAGMAVELLDAETTIGRDPTCTIVFSPNEVLVSAEHATISLVEGEHVLRDIGSRNGTFVNGERVAGEIVLEHGDLVQFGAGGPGGRFVIGEGAEPMPTLDAGDLAIASDLLASTRAEEEPSAPATTGEMTTTRAMLAVAVQRGTRNRSALLIVAAIAILGILTVLVWQQRSKAELERALAELSESLESERDSRFALEAEIAEFQIQADSLQVLLGDDQVRQAIDSRANATAIRQMSSAVALLVFTYGYVEGDGDRMLRYDVDENGNARIISGPGGRPTRSFSFGGAGDPIQRQGTATAFLIDSSGALVTNRHVAEPWAQDELLSFLRSRGQDVEGRFTDLRAYFPPGGQSYPLTIERVSRHADVAVARIAGPPPRQSALLLAPSAGSIGPADPLVLIAYPTGLHNLLFRESEAERRSILQAVGSDARLLAAELSSRRLIQPLVMNGSVTDTTPREVIHSAGATMGASGGPLIDMQQRVIGIHYASVRSPSPGDPFQTQRGVPVRYAWDILPIDVRRRLGGQN